MTLQEFCGPVWRGGVKKVHRSLRWQKTASPCPSVGEDPKKGEVRLLFTFRTDSNHLLWEGFLVGPMAAPILHQRSVQGQKRNPRKLTQHPQPMAHQKLQLRKPLSLRTELAKVQSHHTQRQTCKTLICSTKTCRALICSTKICLCSTRTNVFLSKTFLLCTQTFLYLPKACLPPPSKTFLPRTSTRPHLHLPSLLSFPTTSPLQSQACLLRPTTLLQSSAILLP